MRALTRRWWLGGRAAWSASVLSSTLLFAACGIFDAPRPLPQPLPSPANVLANGGLESGDSPWIRPVLTGSDGFSISDSVAHSGTHSLSLNLAGDASETGTRLVGGVQTIRTTEFPEYLSGFYRVDDWRPAATYQYIQAVVAVHGGDFGDAFPVHEIRFALAGLTRTPFVVPYAQFIFLNRAAPVLHQWVYFDYPLRQAFTTGPGKLPTRWDSIDIRLEVRYDAKTAVEGATSGQVYFDDLYVGPQAANPNRSPEP